MLAAWLLLVHAQVSAQAAASPAAAAPAAAPAPAAAEVVMTQEIDPWVVCFVRAVDDTRTALGPKVEELLKTALLSNTSVTVAPTEELVDAANKKKLARRKWLEPGVLGPVADELDVDYLLSAVVKAETRYAYKVTLTALDRSATTVVATSEVQIAVAPGKGRGAASFSSAEAQELVEKLIAALPPPAVISVPVDPSVAAGAGDPVASGADGFDTDWGDPADASTANVDALLNTLAPTIGGRLGVDSFFHPSDLYAPRDENEVAGRQQVDLGLRANVGGNKASGHLALLVRRDFADATRARLEAEEAWAEVDVAGLKLRAGRAYIAWGTADLYAPTEVLAHFDYRDFLDIEKFPTWHARASYTFAPITVEAYVLPVPELHILPTVERVDVDGVIAGRNRWVKGQFAFDAGPSGPRAGPQFLPITVKLNDAKAPPPTLSNLQPAVRVRASAFGVDASVGAAYLWDRFPTIRRPDIAALVAATPQESVTVTITPEVLRRMALTSDVEWTLGALRISGEGLVMLTEDTFAGTALFAEGDPDIEDPFGTVIVGVDGETPKWAEDHSIRFFVNATGTMSFGKGPLPRDPIGRLRYPLPLALLGRAEYLVGETFKAELTAVDNLAGIDVFGADIGGELLDHDLVLQPAVQMVFADVVTARVEAAWLLGDPAGTFGQFPENSRVGGSLGVSF